MTPTLPQAGACRTVKKARLSGDAPNRPPVGRDLFGRSAQAVHLGLEFGHQAVAFAVLEPLANGIEYGVSLPARWPGCAAASNRVNS